VKKNFLDNTEVMQIEKT